MIKTEKPMSIVTMLALTALVALNVSGAPSMRRSMGLVFYEIAPQQLAPSSGIGAVVRFVVPGSAAAEAGIQKGDILTSVDGHEVKDSATAIAAIASPTQGCMRLVLQKVREQPRALCVLPRLMAETALGQVSENISSLSPIAVFAVYLGKEEVYDLSVDTIESLGVSQSKRVGPLLRTCITALPSLDQSFPECFEEGNVPWSRLPKDRTYEIVLYPLRVDGDHIFADTALAELRLVGVISSDSEGHARRVVLFARARPREGESSYQMAFVGKFVGSEKYRIVAAAKDCASLEDDITGKQAKVCVDVRKAR
jgi:hypothetical protein